MTPADRARYGSTAVARLRDLRTAATAPRPAYDAFISALRVRAPRLVVVPAFVGLNVAAFLLFRGDANLGTKTTNGEWWRLLTSAFLHGGVFQLIVGSVVLMYAGSIVERLIGRAAFAAVYVSAGVIGGIRHVAAHPIATGTSASAAICGLYGLVFSCVVWQVAWHRRPEPADTPVDEDTPLVCVTMPRIAIKRLAVVAVLFLAGALLDGTVTTAALTSGFLVGACCGLVLTYHAAEHAAGLREVGAVFAACAIVAVLAAMPLRNIADVEPEMARVIAIEARTADAYKDASDRFARQRITADALADVADKTIVPELQAVDARLAALKNVPPEHQPIVAEAREFLRLRTESWRARADAMRRTHSNLRAAAAAGDRDTTWRVQAERRFRSSLAAAGKAEAAERTASEAFERLRYSWRPIAE